jgi:nucleoside-diphosphate-sugar epimerase
MFRGKRFVITGSTGRLGCETAARLEELGAEILPIVLNGYPKQPKRVKWAALRDPLIIQKVGDLKDIKAPDYVINFHWLVDRKLSFTEQLQYELDYGVHRISYFWDWLKEVSCHRFVNISSTKVFSHLNANPISAETDPRPISPYGLAKLTAERFLEAYFYQSNFPVIHLRLCSVASYGEHPTQILSQLFYSAFENKAIKVNSSHTMNLLYIDEAVDLIINAALQADKLNYILATPSIAVDEIAARFEKISGKKLNAEHVDLIPGVTDPVFQSDIELLSASWIRKTALDSMIEKIIDRYLSNFAVSGDLEAKFHSNLTDHLAYHGDKASV